MRRGVPLLRPAAVVAILAAATLITVSSPPGSALGAPTAHLAVVMMENKAFGQIVGNANAPYINKTLIPQGRLFTKYYAAVHPSLPNYLVLTSGRFGTCVGDKCKTAVDPADNLFHQMNGAGVTWKSYAESMPSNCYQKNAGVYAPRHNPAVYYQDVSATGGDGTCSTNDVPYPQLGADIKAGTLPQFVFVTPNLYDDMHTDHKTQPCRLGAPLADEVCQGDHWLKANLPTLLSDGGLNDVTVLVVFDEGVGSDGGGGQVVALEAGPNTCNGCTEPGPFTHYGLFNAVEDWFGLPELHQPVPSL